MALKSVLITGCSAGGIGSALVEVFQKSNLHVFATARDPTKMSHLKALPNVVLLTLDPTLPESVQAAMERVKQETGGTLDYLVSNAGQTLMAPILDFDIETAKSMYDINLWGAVRVTQVFAPLVIAAKGTIVYTCSISSCCRTPWLSIYAGSKAALTQISETLRLELSPFGVKVVSVMTGAVSSRILDSAKDFKLPPNSVYSSIEDTVAARARGEDNVPRMTPQQYAEKVVKEVLDGANWQIWKGGYASSVKFMSNWVPVSLWDSLMIKGTGLDQMKNR